MKIYMIAENEERRDSHGVTYSDSHVLYRLGAWTDERNAQRWVKEINDENAKSRKKAESHYVISVMLRGDVGVQLLPHPHAAHRRAG
jgi:hypothetical protein